MKQKDVEKKVDQRQYAFQTYGHLLNEIKDILRSCEFNLQEFYSKTQHYDPLPDKWVKKKYNKIFTYQ